MQINLHIGTPNKRNKMSFLTVSTAAAVWMMFSAFTQVNTDNCISKGTMNAEEFNLFGTTYKSAVKIADGITLEKKAEGDYQLVFAEDVKPGTLTIATKHENSIAMFAFDAICMKGKTHTFSGKDVSTLKYGYFIE